MPSTSFSQLTGPQTSLLATASPEDIFTSEALDLLVMETNNYAWHQVSTTRLSHCHRGMTLAETK